MWLDTEAGGLVLVLISVTVREWHATQHVMLFRMPYLARCHMIWHWGWIGILSVIPMSGVLLWPTLYTGQWGKTWSFWHDGNCSIWGIHVQAFSFLGGIHVSPTHLLPLAIHGSPFISLGHPYMYVTYPTLSPSHLSECYPSLPMWAINVVLSPHSMGHTCLIYPSLYSNRVSLTSLFPWAIEVSHSLSLGHPLSLTLLFPLAIYIALTPLFPLTIYIALTPLFPWGIHVPLPFLVSLSLPGTSLTPLFSCPIHVTYPLFPIATNLLLKLLLPLAIYTSLTSPFSCGIHVPLPILLPLAIHVSSSLSLGHPNVTLFFPWPFMWHHSLNLSLSRATYTGMLR